MSRSGPGAVVVFSGLPGTGKSTLADLVARRIGAPCFAGDWLLGALAPHGVLDDLDRSTLLAVHHGLLGRLAIRQLMLGQAAVVDGVVTDAVLAQWATDAAQWGAPVLVVECVCSDVELHRRRIEGRRREIPGWHEVGWDHVERMRAEFPPLRSRHLTADAVNPVEDNVELVLARLERVRSGSGSGGAG